MPRVFEKIYNAALMKAEAEGKGGIFQKAADTAVEWSKASQAGRVPFGLKLKHALFSKLVYAKLHARMGGNLKHAVSGGSPLGARLGHFFHGIGVTILEGYGLTETTAPITVNTPERLKIGAVGIPLPGNAVRIAEDGEILATGSASSPATATGPRRTTRSSSRPTAVAGSAPATSAPWTRTAF